MKESIDLFDLSVSEDIKKKYIIEVKDIIKNKNFVLGKKVRDFENNFSKFLNVKYSLGLNSGTDSLEIGLKTLDVKEGDEVIVPGFSFFATSEVILKLGAQPIYCDINLNDLTLDIDHLKKLISNKTKVIIAVHLFGNSASMDEIKKLTRKTNIKIIEDVAQAFGSKYKENYLGSIGEFGCFSFYPTKNLGGFGDGGSITFKKKGYLKTIMSLRNHGLKENYYHEYVGYNSRLDSVQASILNLKLASIKNSLNKRIKNNKKYHKNIDRDKYRIYSQENQPMNVVPLSVKNSKNLNKTKKILEKNNISYGSYYPYGLYEFPISMLTQKKQDFPNTQYIKENIITLPCHGNIDDKKLSRILNILNEI